ncbi:uncharacterized protein RCH25_006645 [Pelodytes ibericus]
MNARNNRVAPLVEHRASEQVALGHSYVDEAYNSKSLCPGILKEQCYQQTSAIRCDRRNALISDHSHDDQNTEKRRDYYNYPCNALLKGNEILPGVPHHYRSNAEVEAFGPESFKCSHNRIMQVNSGFQVDSRHTADHQSAAFGKYLDCCTDNITILPQKKNMVAPLCPSCHQKTVQVVPVTYETSGTPQKRAEGTFSVTRSHHQPHLQTENKHQPTGGSLLTCAEHLKCFVCTCPTIDGRTVCQHCYALSIILWLAIILTLIIVIAATVHRG